MNRLEFLTNRNNIFLKIAGIQSKVERGGAKPAQKKALDLLYGERDSLYSVFKEKHKPCNKGDMFSTESAGGRSIKGVAIDFFVRDGVVYVESYYPIINGNKRSQIAYFSIPHKELKIIV